MRELTAERLRELLSYNPNTGEFIRLTRTSNRIKVGDVAGFAHPQGYRTINVDGRKYLAHRLAWLHVTGEWPSADIDHINGQRADNRWKNLRDVSTSVNIQNRRVANRGSKTGMLGVDFHAVRGKYRASITLAGKQKFLGYFDSPLAAHAAYLEAKRTKHEGCTL
jgi:hypothetical protein